MELLESVIIGLIEKIKTRLVSNLQFNCDKCDK